MRSPMPVGVRLSTRRLQNSAKPPANASRKNVPRINPWISVHVSRFVNSIGLGADPVWPHHLVVFVLDDVAVPDEEAGTVERGLHAGDLTGVGDDGVLAGSRLPGLRAADGSVLDLLAVDDLEQDLVDVDRVRVLGEVVQLPHLGGAHGGVLGDRVVPAAWNAFPANERAEQRLLRPERLP